MEIEVANKMAVESCHRVLSLMAQPKDQIQYRNMMVETGEAVSKFEKVVSLLNAGLGHARVRRVKNFHTPLPQHILLDSSVGRADCQPKALQLLSNDFRESPVLDLGSNLKSNLSLGNSSLDLSSNGKNPLQVSQQTPPLSNYHFLQQKYQLQQQQLKQQAEMMYRRSNSGISLNFDSSTCTPTMSSSRSFMSSLSVDGSVANLDGNAFHLIGASRSLDQSSYQHKRRCSAKGDDGSVKCGSSGRCHCSKKRLMLVYILYLTFYWFAYLLLFTASYCCFSFSTLNRKHRVKRSIKVPAISNKLADIPPDEYSWRKYGQKPIKGSPHPRYIDCLLYFETLLDCMECFMHCILPYFAMNLVVNVLASSVYFGWCKRSLLFPSFVVCLLFILMIV